ncbi:exonuclease V [Pelobates fuscus]|uniref:exonuclease V n=1 Tax=Pelobates fuscus TaxID=191477 RepID=UPI002FE4AB86
MSDPAEGKNSVAEQAHGAVYEDGDGFSDFSDSELVTLQEEAMIDSCGATSIPEKIVLQNEGNDIQVNIKNDLDTTVDIHRGDRGECSGSYQNSPGSPQTKRKRLPQTPMEKYRMKYLWVTNLCSQTWCEQQMVYELEFPEFLVTEKSAVMNAGSSIHLARELEVHDVVSVKTQTREDTWAIKLLNILSMIPILQSGSHIREFPVFGVLNGVFMAGVIDELGYSSKGELELRELKTRGSRSLPRGAQKRSHQFQVSLYKLLFDGMVSGGLQPELFFQHLYLKPEQSLGPQVIEHASKVGFIASNFKELLELACLNLTFSDLPMIDSLKMEYCYQEDSSLLGCEFVIFEREMVLEQLTFYLAFWKGLRETQGVDIEEAWKCQRCSFSNICEWRTRKSACIQTKRTK